MDSRSDHSRDDFNGRTHLTLVRPNSEVVGTKSCKRSQRSETSDAKVQTNSSHVGSQLRNSSKKFTFFPLQGNRWISDLWNIFLVEHSELKQPSAIMVQTARARLQPRSVPRKYHIQMDAGAAGGQDNV